MGSAPNGALRLMAPDLTDFSRSWGTNRSKISPTCLDDFSFNTANSAASFCCGVRGLRRNICRWNPGSRGVEFFMAYYAIFAKLIPYFTIVDLLN